MVAKVITETPDTVTLVLFTGNERLDYQPGHFCTIDPHQFLALKRFTAFLEHQKGKREPPRAYSLSSAPHEKYVAITVKEEVYVKGTTQYPPLLSPLLVRQLPPGTPVNITGFTGPYTLPADIESKTNHLVHLVAGSGCVPNFSIIKHALHSGLKLKHTFISSNKTWADTCFRSELNELAQRYPDKLLVHYALTREEDASLFKPNVHRGRISLNLLRTLITEPDSAMVYACGPAIGPHEKAAAKGKGVEPAPRFLETALQQLSALGVKPQHIKYESYG